MELKFAKDIHFTPKHKLQKSPLEVEQLILKVCEKHELTFDGFVIPFVGGQETEFQLSYKPTGMSRIYKVKHLYTLKGDILKTTEDSQKAELSKRCEENGFKLLGWEGEYNGAMKTKAKMLCVRHNTPFVMPLSKALHRELLCSCCSKEKVLVAKNGCKTLDEVREKRETKIKGLCKEGGYTFVCWLTEQMDVKSTRFRCSCPEHGEWDLSIREPWDRDLLICPSCLSDRRSLETGEYNAKRLMTRPTYFYIQKLGDDYIKFGFSTNTKTRMYQQSRLSKYEHELVFNHLFEKGWQAIDLEKGLKLHIKDKMASRHDVPDGWTETRPAKYLPKAIKFIEEYMALNPEYPLYLENIDTREHYTEEEIIKSLENITFDFSHEDDYSELELEPLDAL